MSQKKIEKLTPEQEALIPVYREKWRKIALSTEPIQPEKARKAIEKAYLLVGLPTPEIIFFDSPYTAFHYLTSQGINYSGRNSLSLKLDDLCDPLRVEEYYYFDRQKWQHSFYLDNQGNWIQDSDFNEQRSQNIAKKKLVWQIWDRLHSCRPFSFYSSIILSSLFWQ